MPTRQLPSPETAHTPPLFWWIVLASIAVALVPTVWTALDLVAAGLVSSPSAAVSAKSWFWVEMINLYVPAVFRLAIVVALVGWLFGTFSRYGRQWRLQLAFMVLAGTLGPGLVVNLGFKDNWQRARPYQVVQFGGTQQFTRAAVMTDQCNNNCSFVSGHVACGFFLVSVMLVQRKRRVAWAVSGVTAGLLIGFSRMSDSAHWLSDVLWACPITLMTSWLVWKFLLWSYRARPSAAVA